MFCPKCGKPEQKEDSYCRQCGTFLPDFDKIKSKEPTPEQHFIANLVLNGMTAVVSLGLAITLYVIFLGKEDTPFVIYLTAGFLTAMFFWQVQIFWRTLQLKKQFPKRGNETTKDKQENPPFESVKTKELLPEADFENVIQPSVTENTTKHLRQKVKRKSS